MKRDLAEVITKAIDYRLAQLRVAIPGKVKAYYADKQAADIQPLVNSAMPLEDGTLVEELPILYGIPVEFPRGGGYAVMFPLDPNDTGMIDFCDFSIDLWRSSGNQGAPNDLRTHALGNAVFRPGLHHGKNNIPSPPSGAMIGAETGKRIHVTKTGVFLGKAGATEALVLGTDFRAKQAVFDTALNALFTALATGWTSEAAGWTALAAAFTGMASDPVFAALCSVAAAACTTAAGACVPIALAATTCAGACTTGASAVTTFDNGSPTLYLSSVSKTE